MSKLARSTSTSPGRSRVKGNTCMIFFCSNWSKRNLLINHLKYFWLWFQIRQYIWLFLYSAYSQYTYKFFLHILCIRIFFVYSYIRFRSTLPRIHTVKICLICLILRILRKCKDSFRIFTAYIEFISTYSKYINRFIPCVWQMRQKLFGFGELNYFLLSF
jgi:hypothetical protein